MAQVSIRLGPLVVEIEDEDCGFKPLARKAQALVLDLSDKLTFLEQEEGVEDGE